MLDHVGSATIFTKLDLHSGFHQIKVVPEHRERTAFKTKYGTFMYNVMPFGLCNAPSTFQRTMDLIFQDLRDFAGAYIDDILIFSKDLTDHLYHLRQVYQRLDREKFFANPPKCTFGQPEVEYCGFIVGDQGIRAQPGKLMAIHCWPKLIDQTDIKSFLGLCAFYQRFIPDYATIATPLTDLLHKNTPWVWGDIPAASL